MPTPLTRSAVALLAIAGSAALLSGCRVSQTTASAAASTAAGSTAGTAQATAATADPATPDAGTEATPAPATPTPSGAVTVSISSPVVRSGTAAVAVSCAPGHVYRAGAVSAVVDGDQISFSVTIPGYRGPGSYPAVVSETFRSGSGTVTSVAAVPRVPAVITAAGGSFSVSATGAQGRILAGSLSWTCG